MLSEFEYSYFDPGLKASGSSAAYVSRTAGGGATSRDDVSAVTKPSVLLKSGTPLVWASSWASVTFDQAAGWSGNREPTVSFRLSRPSATVDSTTAPVTAFATLASRMWSSPVGATPVATSAAPSACTTVVIAALDDGDDARRPTGRRDDLGERGIQCLVGCCSSRA